MQMHMQLSKYASHFIYLLTGVWPHATGLYSATDSVAFAVAHKF